ncbi:MAG: transposase [Candidatus Daviesbacteria bacterium]|nr:transposase [Candidatus Daviesbacteria bacterium]
MPGKNSVKQYTDKGYYHIYNRGVEKRIIFQEIQDYLVFLSYLKNYLLPKDEEKLKEKLSNPDTSYTDRDKIIKLLRLNNFADEINLLAYCLMPNHFHFFIYQNSSISMDKFMNSLATRYSMYFNRKYKRVGPLYQDVYKAVLVANEEQFLHLTRYIHKQALALQGDALQHGMTDQPSSYLDYIGNRKTKWVKTEEVLLYFSKSNPKLSYRAFVEEKDDIELISELTLEDI